MVTQLELEINKFQVPMLLVDLSSSPLQELWLHYMKQREVIQGVIYSRCISQGSIGTQGTRK